MGLDIRGVRHLKTLTGLVDRRHARTSSGALLELSMLATEKRRLKNEMQRAERRNDEIRSRLGEIDTKEQRLQVFVETGRPLSVATASSHPPIHSPLPGKLKLRQVRY